MTSSVPLIFFGNERLSTGFQPIGAPTLQALIDAGYHIAAVVAHYQAGSSRTVRSLEVEAVAKAHNIPLLLPERPSDIKKQLASYNAIAGVLVAYGKLIPQSIIDLFPRGIINIHPSLLPAYRGPTPIESAMLDGARQTGVSIMQLVKAMDAGPLYAQDTIKLTGHETKQVLTEHLLQMGGKLLLSVLPAILDGALEPKIQSENDVTFTTLIHKSDGAIDLDKSAQRLEREIRAYASWPKSSLELFGHQVVVTKARIATNQTDGDLVLACKPGFLEVLQLVAPSGRTMSGADFLRGYKK